MAGNGYDAAASRLWNNKATKCVCPPYPPGLRLAFFPPHHTQEQKARSNHFNPPPSHVCALNRSVSSHPESALATRPAYEPTESPR